MGLDYWLYSFLAGVSQVFSTLLLSKSFKYGEISVTVTIWKVQVVLLAAFGVIFLGETITYMGIAGILVSLFGIYLLNVRRARLSLVEPLLLLLRERGLRFALLAALTIYVVKVIAVGTGQALQMGEECNADVLLVHAPASEVAFMEKGAGKERSLVMHNDFVIVGPAEDPAGITRVSSTAEALQIFARTEAPFVSRGDDSVTYKTELALWKIAEVEPAGDWYIETGQGMGATLKVEDEKDAYTLTDRATYLANKDNLGLDVLYEGDAALLNV